MFSPEVLDRANVLEFRIEANDIEIILAIDTRRIYRWIRGQGTALGATLVRAAMQQVDTPSDVRAGSNPKCCCSSTRLNRMASSLATG